MRFLLKLAILIIITSSISHTQSIRENLDYINKQCERFNTYNTVFNIDTENKALVIFDDLGTALCYFEDIEFDYSEDSKISFDLICIDGGGCIDQQIEDEYNTFEKYTIELKGGNIAKVVEKLNEIKTIILKD